MKNQETKSAVNFSEDYLVELGSRYDSRIVNELKNVRYAPVPGRDGEQLAYVRLEQGAGEKPIFYVPGFTESIIVLMLSCPINTTKAY
jgi:hypothetical protein